MGQLVALDAIGELAFVDALRAAWEAGDAVLPVDPRLSAAASKRLVETLRVGDAVNDGDALVIATSGTTGEPKGVVLTHDAIRASAAATSARLGVDPDTDRWLACLPLAHVGGLGVVLRALVTGTPLVLHRSFDPAAAEASGATLVSLVATALGRLRHPARFRTILLGGAAPPDEIPANAVVTYGMTETGGGVVYDGMPLDGVEVRVGDSGDIAVRGPALLRAYRDGTDPKDADGWLPTGDLGAWDGTRLIVQGRGTDLIISGGENVWPASVERVVAGVAGVAEVAIVGRADPEWGQRVVAVIVPTDPAAPPSLDEVRNAVKAAIGPWAAPKELELVDALPRTSLGKIHRAAVP